MAQKIKFFIDFDNTLFDPRPLKKAIFDVFESAGFAKDEVSSSYKEVCRLFDNNYSPERQAKFLFETRSFDEDYALKKINKAVRECSGYLFSDSIDFLAGLDHEKFEIMLLSYGDKKFQSDKVKCCGVEKYFNKLYFCQEEKWIFLKKLVEPGERFIIIDDRGDALDNIAKEFNNSLTIQIKRADEPLDIAEHFSAYDGISVTDLFSAEKYLV